MNRLFGRLKHWKFQRKLILSYVVVTIIPLIVLGVFSYEKARYYIEQQVSNKMETSLSIVVSGLNGRIAEYKKVADLLAFNRRMLDNLSAPAYDAFSLYDDLNFYFYPLIGDIRFLNKDITDIKFYSLNNLPKNWLFEPVTEDIAQLPWFVQTGNQSALWLEDDRFFLSKRLVNPAKITKMVGLLYIDLDPTALFDDLKALFAEGCSLAIFDTQGTLLWSHAPEELAATATSDNGRYRVFEQTIDETGWLLTVHYPIRHMTAGVQDILGATVLIVLICLAVLLLVSWLFSATFVRRILRLNEQMRHVQEGNMEFRPESDSQDEIGELTERFRQMMLQINTLIEDVYKSQITQREAEFKALQAQINPHFLHNVLSMITWKAKMIYAHDISRIATAISLFYRTTLNSGKNIISIQDEVANIRAYLDIQSMLCGNAFEVSCAFDEDIFAYDTIKLILQPIVENAIKHGIECRKEGGGVLRIGGKRVGNDIVFEVIDNGPGIEAERINGLLNVQSEGYGMANVHNRIRLFFGETYGLAIRSDPGSGTWVTLTIPAYHSL